MSVCKICPRFKIMVFSVLGNLLLRYKPQQDGGGGRLTESHHELMRSVRNLEGKDTDESVK